MAQANKRVTATKSVRQQIKAFTELERTESPDDIITDVVLYFAEEFRYSTVKVRQLLPPQAPKVGAVVKVKGTGKDVFVGTVVGIGMESSCRDVQVGLEAAMKIAEDVKSRRQTNEEAEEHIDSGSDYDPTLDEIADGFSDDDHGTNNHPQMKATLQKEKEKLLSIVEKIGKPTEPQSSTPADNGLVLGELQKITKLLMEVKDQLVINNQLLRERGQGAVTAQPVCTPKQQDMITAHASTSRAGQFSPIGSPPNAKRSREEVDEQHQDEVHEHNKVELVYNGTNLLSEVHAPAKDPSLYATRLLGILFHSDELERGAVEKSSRSTRVELDPHRVKMLKDCISAKYGGPQKLHKIWSNIRNSLNQKCRDTKRRKSLSMEAKKIE